MLGGRCRTSDTDVNLTCKVVETSEYDFLDGFPVYLATASRTWGGVNDVDGFPTTFSAGAQVTYSHNRAFVMQGTTTNAYKPPITSLVWGVLT